MKKGKTVPKPFYCKVCGDPITKVRLLSHGMCLRCSGVAAAKRWHNEHQEESKEYMRKYSKKRHERGFGSIGEKLSAVVCNACGEYIKGGFNKTSGAIKTFRNRAVKCPFCGHLHKQNTPLRIVHIRRTKRRKVHNFSRWDIYKHLPDVEEFLGSIPNELETVEELRKRVKIEPLDKKRFKRFDRERNKLMKRKRRSG